VWIFECHVKQEDGASNSLDGHIMRHYLPVTVLQPGWYKLERSGQAHAKYSVKYLQNSIITGHISTGWNRRRATLDQLVKVRILLRQLLKFLQIAG